MKTLSAILAAVSFLLAQPSALAAIGQNEKTVDSDVLLLQGSRKIVSQPQCRVHEIKTEAQTVREYSTLDGTVFAVTWNGVGEPDLGMLFANYYNEYSRSDIATPTPAGRRPKKIQSENLVVLKFGQMRNVHGRAYMPNLVPPGFNLKDIH